MSANEGSKHFKVLDNFSLKLETLNLMKIIVCRHESAFEQHIDLTECFVYTNSIENVNEGC